MSSAYNHIFKKASFALNHEVNIRWITLPID